MNYLLDTHVALWWLTDPSRISAKARKIISDKSQKIYISSASFWEMAIKQKIRRLNIPNNIITILLSEGFEFLPIRPEEGLSVADLPLIHNDPFDRMLIAQAKLNDLVFITKDKKILEYPLVTIQA